MSQKENVVHLHPLDGRVEILKGEHPNSGGGQGVGLKDDRAAGGAVPGGRKLRLWRLRQLVALLNCAQQH